VKKNGKTDTCYGKIVNFSSISGRRGRELQIHYASSKAAIISLTQSAALALAPFGINVNAVSPSVVKTPMWEKNVKEKSIAFNQDVLEENKRFIARIPLQREGSVEEMANAVAFLCSDQSNYITGQTLNVDGGFEMD
jgi:D-sorbitol dehydrogenase (acceptor)